MSAKPSTGAPPTPQTRFPYGHFARRHLGPDEAEQEAMLGEIGCESLGRLMAEAVPESIRSLEALHLPAALGEHEALGKLHRRMRKNQTRRSLLGMGYHDCLVPAVIQRNVLENPGWYTAYTPYQAEIAQGRLEALLNFQTMVSDLCGLPVANASLLDEATAAAEAIALARSSKPRGTTVFVADTCHPQVIEVIETRLEPLGLQVVLGDWQACAPEEISGLFAVILPFPNTFGRLCDPEAFLAKARAAGVISIVTSDLLALTLLKPPGEMGADIVVGSAQRFGVPLGYGGPHAGFIACSDKLKRKLPGRLIGVSQDARGNPALRLALQTREQHIRRDRATSNICTAQVLLAVMASMYAVYHGPEGLRSIARRVHGLASRLAKGLGLAEEAFFDTVHLPKVSERALLLEKAREAGFNLRAVGEAGLVIALDERSGEEEVDQLLQLLGGRAGEESDEIRLPESLQRTSDFLTHDVFHRYHSETEMMRYLRRLESKDLALNQSMIPLGSCTMKLNAAIEMMPVTWPEVGGLHPFAPLDQAEGYLEMFQELVTWLAEVTGFAGVSLQPNAGSQGEYAGLLAIRAYHRSRGDEQRDICLIPTSAHGTNPASAVMVGMKVIPVGCDREGNIDLADLQAKCQEHAARLAALMVTYPSTHGVFEEGIVDVCQVVHEHGGQVYMDGANMNAQVGLTSPGRVGADVCHLNLHKTFCIPHGGGGPGVGPIGVAEHLLDFLPGHRFLGESAQGAVSAAPFGSSSINVISWMYIAMMGAEGLKAASEIAILNANYMAHRLESRFPVLYKGRRGRVAHECIIDLRAVQEELGLTVEDIAKRLMDYGYHAPTMSWPVAGTLMIEPTESESKEELDRFCDALLLIHGEIEAVRHGEADPLDNPLKGAPHTALEVCSDQWTHAYSRELAAFPSEASRRHKFWPTVSRIDNVHGDRNLVCTCEGMEAYAED
ncbi:MAG: aminomethyl-transferring glycine dehydrogenase [Verrucomicrobiota bacterium]